MIYIAATMKIKTVVTCRMLKRTIILTTVMRRISAEFFDKGIKDLFTV